MRYVLSFILFIILSVSANATDYYFCDTGNDSGAGTINDPWASIEKFRTVSTLSAGDNRYFCEGGEWLYPDATNTYIGGTCEVDNRCNITSYQAPDIAPEDVGVLPWIDAGATAYNVFRTNGHLKFVTISRIDMRRATWQHANNTPAQQAIFIYGGDMRGIIVENNNFENMRVGIESGDVSLSVGVVDLKVRNNRFENMSSVGLLVGADGLSITNNTFNLNGSQHGGGRPIYINGSRDTTSPDLHRNTTISGNTITNSSPSNNGSGAGDYNGVWEAGMFGAYRQTIGGHGNMGGYTYIANNTTTEIKGSGLGGGLGGGWGISIDSGWAQPDEQYPNLRMLNNEAYWTGNQSFGCNACIGSKFQNNIGYSDREATGISVPAKSEAATDIKTTSSMAEYNLFVFDYDNTGGLARGVAMYNGNEVNLISDIQYNVIIFGNDSTNNKCAAYETGSTYQNNFCFAVNSAGNIINHTATIVE
jgi:hypothetical protein